MHVSLNKKQKISIVAIIIMSIIATILVKTINQDESNTVSKTAEATATVTKTPEKTVTKTPKETVTETPKVTVTKAMPPKETSTPESTKSKETTKSNEKTEVEFETIKHLSDIYPLQFSFKSDVILNRIEEEIGDVYIIYGSDDDIHGCHSHEYLYGVNKHTGQKIWSFYGDYYSPQYYISEDEKYITLLNLVKGYIECFEIQTGTLMLKETFTGYVSEYSYYEFSDVIIVELDKSIVAVNKDNWKVIWKINAIHRLSEDEKHMYCFDENDFKAKCLEISTGKIIWEKELDTNSHLENSFYECSLTKELFVIFSKKNIIAFNTADGNIAWERKFEEEAKDQYKSFGVDYSIYNDLLVLKYDGNLTAIDAKDGELLWDTPIKEVVKSKKIYKASFNDMEIFVLLGNDYIYAIDTKTGDIIIEFHEEGIAEFYKKVELKDNTLYLDPVDTIIDYKNINLETGEIEYIPRKEEQINERHYLEELLTGKDFYDGIGVSPGYDSDLEENFIIGVDENGFEKWIYFYFNNFFDKYGSFASLYTIYYHAPIRIKNNVYIDYEGAIVCVDALTGKVLFQLGKYDCSEIVELNNGTYWFLGYNNNLDVYKID